MKRHSFLVIAWLLLTLQVATATLPTLGEAQRAQDRGGRSAKQSSDVKRSGTARSGTTGRKTAPRSTSPSTPQRSPSRSTPQRSPSHATGRRTSPRRTSTARKPTRQRTRRVHRSRRYRRGRWRHHRYWQHRRWYRGFWVGRVLITTAAFVVIANSSTTVVVHSTTFYYYNPWYRRALYDGEEVYVLTSAPIGYEADQLPDGAETIQVEGTTYYYADWSFYQDAPGGGYVVVEPPAGAEVSAIPEEAIAHEEGEVPLYQFDETYFTKDTNDAGREVYRVEPQPPEEELDAIPDGSVSFVADGETYYYVNQSLYVEYEEDGKTGFVNGEPEIGAQLDALPEGTTAIEEDGFTFYQFDMVFFEEVEDENGQPFYEVIDSPDGSESVELSGN